MSRFFCPFFLLTLLLMGCRTGKVSISQLTEVDTTHVQSVRDSVTTSSIVEKIKIDTTKYTYLIETFLYDTERTENDGTHPVKQHTTIHATQQNQITETETEQDTTEQIAEVIKVDHNNTITSYTKEKKTRPRGLLFISVFTFTLIILLFVGWKKGWKFW